MKKKTLFTLLIFILFLLVIKFFIWDSVIKEQDSEFLRVGISADYPPFAYFDIKENKVSGFDIELVKKIAEALKLKPKFHDMPFNSLLLELRSHSVDLLASGLTPSAEKRAMVEFSDNYLTQDPITIVTLKNNNFKTIDELKGKKVAVNTGYSADYFISKFSGIEIVRLKNPSDSLLMLKNKAVDAFICAKSCVDSILASNKNYDFNIAEIPDSSEKYAFVVSKDSKELLFKVNKILDKLSSDGTLDALKKKWNLK